jgi:hypothetical protein
MNANETAVRNASQVAEDKDVAAWVMDVAVFEQGKIRGLYVFVDQAH